MLNITKLTHAIAENNNSTALQELFEAAGEINEDPAGAFKLIPHKDGLQVQPHKSKESVYEIYMGMHWLNEEEDGQPEIADVVLFWNSDINELTSAQCCGVSFTHEEWENR